MPVALIGAVALAVGLADRGPVSQSEEAGVGSVLAALLVVALIFLWYRRDAQTKGYPTTWGLNAAMALLTVFALPWYLVRSRVGAWQRGKALAGMATLFVLVMACYRIGAGP